MIFSIHSLHHTYVDIPRLFIEYTVRLGTYRNHENLHYRSNFMTKENYDSRWRKWMNISLSSNSVLVTEATGIITTRTRPYRKVEISRVFGLCGTETCPLIPHYGGTSSNTPLGETFENFVSRSGGGGHPWILKVRSLMTICKGSYRTLVWWFNYRSLLWITFRSKETDKISIVDGNEYI